MADRCTAEYERIVAKLGAWMPYRRARGLLAEFFPLGDDLPEVETIRQRTLHVGARFRNEKSAVAGEGPGAGDTSRGDDSLD